MKKDIFFHGTSAKQAASIKKYGFDSNRGNLKWTVSDCKNYFISYRETKKEHECSTKQATLEISLEEAAFHAAFAAAIDGSDSGVIFAVNLGGLNYERDRSCCYPNAVQINSRVSKNRIIHTWRSKKTAAILAPFVVASIGRNRFLNRSNIPQHVLDLAKNVVDGFYLPEALGGFFPALFD